MKPEISKLFLKERSGENEAFKLNPDIKLVSSNEQEAAKFLADAIRTWKAVFSHEIRDPETGMRSKNPCDIPEDKLILSYRMFRGKPAESYFVPVVELIEKILPEFTDLSFVKKSVICPCGCGHIKYSFSFSDLVFFSKEGREGLLLRETEKKQQEKREAQAYAREELDKLLAGRTVSEEVKAQLLQDVPDNLTVADPHVVLFVSMRSEYGSSGGVGYWSQVHCICKDQKQMQEWQWRDRYSAANDNPRLRFDELGKVKITRSGRTTTVNVQLINKKYGNRFTSFDFRPSTARKTPHLTAEEQVRFEQQAQEAGERVMAEFMRLHALKPTMSGTRGPTGYFPPRFKEQEIRAELGVAAFVVEEQIDHHVDDRQIRLDLYTFRNGQKNAEFKAESHGYESAGGAFLTILDIDQDKVLINTENGKSEVEI